MHILNFIFVMFLFWLKTPIAGAGVVLTALFVFVVVLFVVGFVIFSYKQQQKRLEQMQAFAAQNGWTFVPDAGLHTFQNANYYSLFSAGRTKQILGLMHRPLDNGRQMIVFDYKYVTGHGKNSRTYHQTVTALFSPQLQLPFFALYPESFLSFIGELVGYNDIDFDTHPHFSKRYKLSGRDEMRIRQTFNQQVLTHFDHLPTVNIDGGGNYLFAYVPHEKVKIENLNAFINERMNFLNLFHQ